MESTSSSSSSEIYNNIVSTEDAEFDNRLNVELSVVQMDDFDGHSAITMSPDNSDIGSGSDSGSGSDVYCPDNRVYYKAITCKEIEAKLNREYTNGEELVNEIDILSVYVKFQKRIFIDAKNMMNLRLYSLGVPSICISIAASALTPFTSKTAHSIITTYLNAILTVFIILIIGLRLEASSTKYEFIASKYSKLQDDMDDFYSKIAFIGSRHEKEKMIFTQMKKTDHKIAEIKDESSIILLPHYLRYLYPKISSINIFSSIHSVELHRKNLIKLLKGVINEMRYINAKWDAEDENKKKDPKFNISGFYRVKEQTRLTTLKTMKGQLKTDLTKYKNTYSFIDGVFQQEINTKMSRQIWWLYNILCFGFTIEVNDKVLKFD